MVVQAETITRQILLQPIFFKSLTHFKRHYGTREAADLR